MKSRFPYIAGYIDGDGCLYIGKYNANSITIYEYSIQVLSVKREVLEYFKTEFGGYILKKPERPRHRKAYVWTIKNKAAQKVSIKSGKFMIDKVYQCLLFIQYFKTIKRNQFRTVKPHTIEQREEAIRLIRKDKTMANVITKEFVEAAKKLSKTVPIIPQDDYPYLAGLLDSEGCFRIKKWKPKNKPNYVHNITIEVGNTRYPILKWLIERFGGSIVYIPPKANKRASGTWTLSAAALYEILKEVRPYLHTKKEVCDKLIEFQQTILANGGDRHSELFRAMFEKRQEIRDRIVTEVHDFNRTGSH